MAEMPDYDVAIVGASIAGCTAATLLGRQGAKVALIESHSDPAAWKRICTHFIQASASPTIHRLGIEDRLREAHARQTDTNMWTRYGWISFARESAQPRLLDPDVAYAFPTDSELTCLAVFPSKNTLGEFKPEPEQAMARVFETLPDG